MDKPLTFWEAEMLFQQMIMDYMEKNPLSEIKLANAQLTNAPVRYSVYFEQFLSLHSYAILSVYHEHLRASLLKSAQVDIGEYPFTLQD